MFYYYIPMQHNRRKIKNLMGLISPVFVRKGIQEAVNSCEASLVPQSLLSNGGGVSVFFISDQEGVSVQSFRKEDLCCRSWQALPTV